MFIKKYLPQPLAFIAASFLIFLNDAAAQQPDSIKQLPLAHWARSRTLDLKHLALDLRFDWKKKQAFGTAAISLSPLNATDQVLLDAGMLTINAIALASGKRLTFDYDGGDKNDGLKINLDRVYQVNEELTIRIDYHTNWHNHTDPNNIWGSNGKGIRFFTPTANDLRKRRQMWSNGEPEANRYWFPSYDAPNDLRTTEFIATVEKDLTVISNGKLAGTKDNADGTRTFHWKMDTPYANHLTSFVIGEYTDFKQDYDGVALHSFGYPDEAEATAASVVRLPDMIKFFSERLGVKYPYPSYAQVFVQELPNWLGNSTTSTITENMVDDYRTHAEFFYLWDLTEAEALVHQWFGNYLTSRDWSHVWLNKGFARYLSGLYAEYKNGREEFLLYQHTFDHNTLYLGDWNAGIRHPIVTRHYADATAFVNANNPYAHAAGVLHMLRKHLGEEKWWKAVGHYVKSNANQMVTTEDFREAVEEATGEAMDWFFDQWFYKMGHPIFEVTQRYDDANKQLILTVKQTQQRDPRCEYPQVEFFRGKVDIEIDEEIKSVWLEAKAENTFTFNRTSEPKLVNFDYESTWTKELKFEKSLEALRYQLQNDKDILGQQWALGQLVTLARNEKTSVADKEKIYAGLRHKIMSNAYWRLRYNATLQLQGLLAPANEAKPQPLDDATIAMLLTLIKREKAWNRAAAITFLGTTRNPKYADVYLKYFDDESDRVINAAANALGKSKSRKAFNALVKLKEKPSWKNQSLISALNGLKELGDPRGFDIAFEALSDLRSPRWTLATPVWDFRLAAAEAIAALGKSAAAYPLILQLFKKSLAENEIADIFTNVLLVATLGDPRGQEIFEELKAKFKDDTNTMKAVDQFEAQFKAALQ